MSRTLPLQLLVLLTGCKAEPSGADGALTPCEISPPDPGLLSTDGRRIVDEHGRQALLRGVNTGGRSKFWPYVPFDFDESLEGAPDFDTALAQYLDHAQAWGATTLRVPFSWNAFEPTPGSWDETWHSRYAALLDAAAARDMWTIIDFHQDIYAESFCGDGFPEWTLDDPGEPQHDCEDWFLAYLEGGDVAAAFDALWADEGELHAAFATMWREMASRHHDRPGVIGYELINEPGWGTADRQSWAVETLTPFYTKMIDAVRDEDPDRLVFFDGTGIDAVAGESPVERPDADHLVFAPHYYDAAIFLGGGDLANANVSELLAAWDSEGDRLDTPILLGEFGAPADQPGIEDYLSAHYDAFDALGMHATQWEYSASTELWNFEDFSLAEADGTPRDALLDAIVRPYPRLVAGTDVAWSYDAESERLDLSYVAEGPGVTEVVVPSWRYGGSFEVSGSGGCTDARHDRLYIETSAAGTVEITLSPSG